MLIRSLWKTVQDNIFVARHLLLDAVKFFGIQHVTIDQQS
jgi:hypothetical protein